MSLPFILGSDHGVVVLRLSGELDSALHTELKTTLAEAAGIGDCVLVDMRDVTYIDSSSISLFIALHHELLARGGSLSIATGSTGVHHVFEIGGLVGPLNAFETARDAAAHLAEACWALPSQAPDREGSQSPPSPE